MFDENKLWKDRASHRLKEIGVYLRYIFNGHLVIVLLFLLGMAAFYYQNWVSGLSASFPAEMIIAILMAVFLTYSPVYNFLLEADQIYLLPLENRLKGYFQRSGLVSLLFQGYILVMILAALMPLYAHVTGKGYRNFFYFLIFLLLLKAWNLIVSWRIQYYIAASVHLSDMLVRFFINGSFTYLVFKQANFLYLLIFLLILTAYYRTFFVRTKKMGLKWDILISQEDKRVSSFYRLANLFTDVPKLRDTVKRRKWLDFFVNRISFSQDKTFHFLLSRTFLRSGDYLGLYIRLTIIGGLALYFISFGWGQLFLGLLFLYLTGFQLMPLWKHHQNKIWVDLYPVALKVKKSAFHSLLLTILLSQSVMFSLVLLLKGQWMISFLMLLSSSIFSFFFVYVYSKSRLKA